MLRNPLTRYRVLAYVVGTGLVLLTCVAMPLKYGGVSDTPVAIVGTAHGFLYMAYVLSVLDLGWKRRWPLVRVLLVCLAGTVPFVSFYAERRVTEIERARQKRAAAPEPVAG